MNERAIVALVHGELDGVHFGVPVPAPARIIRPIDERILSQEDRDAAREEWAERLRAWLAGDYLRAAIPLPRTWHHVYELRGGIDPVPLEYHYQGAELL